MTGYVGITQISFGRRFIFLSDLFRTPLSFLIIGQKNMLVNQKAKAIK
ncbi:hypothetical protein HMPREF3189_01625 [Clostridiales bacterium KA00134]|nr:hypothetical protein HMPREF3189_01625 [Clostridiales bacterium KA00134]